MNPEFGTPPPVSAWTRMRPFLGVALTGGMLAAVTVYALQIVMPEGFKPTEIMGDAAGAFERHEINGKMEARLNYDRRSADAVAQAQAKSQIDQAIITAAIQQQADNLAGFSFAAKLSDMLCVGGKLIAANTQPSLGPDWRQPNTSDWHTVSQNVARSTCGVGDTLRQGMQASLIDVAQNAAASRGMSLTDGGVRQASTVQARPAVPHREWTPEQRAQLVAYSSNLPRAVLVQISDGLDISHGSPPEWFDRIAAHRFEHPER